MAVANASPAPLNLPQPPQAWNTGWQQRYTQALVQASVNWLQKGNDILLDANTTFTLTSPDGTTQVTIVANDDGTIGPVPAAPADIRPQNNTWTGTNTFNGAVTMTSSLTTAGMAASGNVVITSALPAVQFVNTAVGTSSWELNAGTGGGFNLQAITSGGAATTVLNAGASAGTPTAVTITAPTITLTGTVSVTNYATAAQTLSATTNVFGNPAADWAALTPFNMGTTNAPALNRANGIHFYCTSTAAPNITFVSLNAGQSGTIAILNSSGAAFTVSTSAAVPAGANMVVNNGAWGVFSYFYNPAIGVLLTRFY